MKCEEAERLIYLDKELSEAESGKLAEHLSSCSKCAALAASFAQIRVGISAVAAEEVAPVSAESLTNRVMDRVNTPAKKKSVSWWPGLMRWGLSALSLVLILTFYVEYSSTSISTPKKTDGQVTLVHSGGSETLKKPREKRASLISLIQARKTLLTNNDNNSYETN